MPKMISRKSWRFLHLHYIDKFRIGSNTVQYNSQKQAKRTARIQQPRDMCLLQTKIPGFLLIKQAVETLHPDIYVMYVDLLMQDFRKGNDGATDYRWHVDTDEQNNTGDAVPLRTVIVKLTEGISKLQIAGMSETTYGSCAGSWVDFRSDAYHRSVVENGTLHLKFVFFLGHHSNIYDGRDNKRKRVR